jgi:type II secretion system protein G
MAKQSRNLSENINSQNQRSAGKIKLNARELWSLIWPIPLGALGILMMMGSIWEMTHHSGHTSKSQIAKIQIAEFEQVLEMYAKDNGSYPTDEQGLEELLSDNGNGPYLKKKIIPVDPWGHPYHYYNPGVRNPGSYDIWSNGPDGVEWTEDDTYKSPK